MQLIQSHLLTNNYQNLGTLYIAMFGLETNEKDGSRANFIFIDDRAFSTFTDGNSIPCLICSPKNNYYEDRWLSCKKTLCSCNVRYFNNRLLGDGFVFKFDKDEIKHKFLHTYDDSIDFLTRLQLLKSIGIPVDKYRLLKLKDKYS